MTLAARPLCVLLPGTDGTGVFYEGLCRHLDGIETRVLSYPLTGAQSYEHLGAVLLPQLPRDRAYMLIAESFAGPLAIWLAAHARQKPAGLVLAATFAASPFGWFGRLVAPFAGLGHLMPISTSLIDFVLFNGKGRQPAVRVKEIVRKIGRTVIIARVRSALTCDVRGWLGQVTAPVLVLNPTRDRLLPRWRKDGFRTLPDMERVDLDLPHMVFQVEGDRAAQQVGRFIGRLFGDEGAL